MTTEALKKAITLQVNLIDGCLIRRKVNDHLLERHNDLLAELRFELSQKEGRPKTTK